MHNKVTVHKNIYYWENYNAAKKWAIDHQWPTDRIISYELGFAIQMYKSGPYAGPNTYLYKGEKAMNKKEIKELVARGHQLDKEINRRQVELNGIKIQLKEYAMQHKLSSIIGDGNTSAIFTDKNEVTIQTDKLYDFIKKSVDKKHYLDVFFKCVKVNITNVRKELGKNHLNIPEIKIVTDKYHCIKFGKEK